MSTTVDATLLPELKAYGAFDISACFNCGNCSAVCPLSAGEDSFPRKMIRRGQLGLRDELLSRQEMWLCYNCGDCSATCPRQAGPSDYMAALRSWAAAQHEPTGLGRLLGRRPWTLPLASLGLAALLGLALLEAPAGRPNPAWQFSLIPYGAIHEVGLAVSVLVALFLAWTLARFGRRALAGRGILSRSLGEHRAAAKATLGEILAMARQRPTDDQPGGLRSPRGVHLAIAGGFLALLAATSLDFVFVYLLGHPIFWPARVLGTLGGIALLVGVSAALWRRLRGTDPATRRSRAADWWLLGALWLLAVSGFWLESAVTVHWQGPLQDWVLLFHVVAALELILLLGLGKLSHVVYRPLALYLHYLDGGAKTTGTCASSAPARPRLLA